MKSMWSSIQASMTYAKPEESSFHKFLFSSSFQLKPGREFETDRYLITVEESHHDNQPIPRPSYAVQDPTMKNRPKSAVSGRSCHCSNNVLISAGFRSSTTRSETRPAPSCRLVHSVIDDFL